MWAWKLVAIGVSVAWAAGCILPVGHVDLNAPLWCASAGPGAVAGGCEGGAGGSVERGARPAPSASRPANPVINAVMTVTAYGGDGSVAARWRGPTRWVGSISAAGIMFTGDVSRGRVTWDRASAEDVRVEMKRDGTGGLPLRRWLMDRAPDAVRVSVVVTRSGDADRAGERGADDAGDPRGNDDDGRGNASGDGRGRVRQGPRDGGDGSHATGTRGGSPRGSGARSSWVDEPTAALSPRGGRVPGTNGAEGGSPAGTGKPGDHGLSVGMPVFGGVISVPPSIAPALDVAAILAEAGASPTALASKWFNRSLRVGVRQLRREFGQEAAKRAARAVDETRTRLWTSIDYRVLPAAEQRRILDITDDAVRREYLARVEDGIARKIADLEQTPALARPRTQPRTGPQRYVDNKLREHLEAARRVQRATRQARNDLGPAPAQASSSAATGSGTAIRRVGDLLESVDDVLANPRLLDNLNPADLQLRLGGRIPSGWRVEALGRGSHRGQGFVLRQFTPRGHPTGRQLRWHPGGGHHGPDPYWRVLDGTAKSDIIPAAPWPR